VTTVASPGDEAPQFLDANGLRFAYLASGQGPLVLLVHGFPDTAHSWDVVRPRIAAAGYRVVAPFQRGYSPSGRPPHDDYDSDVLGTDVLAWIDALGSKDAIVVGHDWGASAAYSAVGIDASKIQLLVTVGIPHPGGIRPSPRLLWAARHFFSLRRKHAAEWIREGDLRHLDELVQRWSPKWNVPAGETDAAKASLRPPGALEAALGYYRALRPYPPRAQRNPVTVPAVAFAGTDDQIPPSIYEQARRHYRASYEVVTMPGGHFMHREYPDRFIELLLGVLAKAPR